VHDDHVALTRVLEHGAQSGPIDSYPGLLIDEDPLACDPDLGQRLDLAVDILLDRRFGYYREAWLDDGWPHALATHVLRLIQPPALGAAASGEFCRCHVSTRSERVDD
jgi:hypothetical protein